MKIDRRMLLISSLAYFLSSKETFAEEKDSFAKDHWACLVDTTLCIGCRK